MPTIMGMQTRTDCLVPPVIRRRAPLRCVADGCRVVQDAYGGRWPI
jgi:hypothetical protein